MLSKILLIVFHIQLCFHFCSGKPQTFIRVGYWQPGSGSSAAEINSNLFTHLICVYADINSSTYQLSLPYPIISRFSFTVKQKNPTVTTLLSVGSAASDYSTYLSMMNTSSIRKTFIDSSINSARLYNFQGLDFNWLFAINNLEIFNLGLLFNEWRAAIDLEASNSGLSKLILTAVGLYTPKPTDYWSTSFPIELIQKDLDWIHVESFEFFAPAWWWNHTAAPAPLFDPNSNLTVDKSIRAWIDARVSPDKLVMGMTYYGYSWVLASSQENGIGASAFGPGLIWNDYSGLAVSGTSQGRMMYKEIGNYVQTYGVSVQYDKTYGVNFCTNGTTWIGFDGVEAVKAKVSYAKDKNLLGYFVWHVGYDRNWELSKAAG